MGLSSVATKFATGTYTVRRTAAGTLEKGIYTPGDVYEFLMTASIQPVSGRDLDDAPEGQDGREMKVVYSETELRSVMPRDPLVGAIEFVADDSADTLASTDHGLSTGDGPYQIEIDEDLEGAAAPGGLEVSINYWVIKVDDDTFQLAASREDALALTFIDILDEGTGDLSLFVSGNHPDKVVIKGEEWECVKSEPWEYWDNGKHWRAYIARSLGAQP